MKEIKTVLTQTKVTKNTVRYDHPEGEGIVPAIYLKKSHVPHPFPKLIEVTIGFPE